MSREERLAVFCAALSGITANPAFFGPLYQQRTDLAAEFAMSCVVHAEAALAERDDQKVQF